MRPPNSQSADSAVAVRPVGSSAACALEVRCEAGVVAVRGEVDVDTLADFRRALERCGADPLVHTLDLTGVSFFSAAGAGALVEAQWTRRPHPVIIASEAVQRLVGICGLETLLGERSPSGSGV